MAFTKIEFWLTTVLIVLIISLSTMYVGADLKAIGNLDDKSNEYVDQFSSNLQEADIEKYAEDTTQEDKKRNPLLSKVESLPLVSDFLGAVNFFVDVTRDVSNFLSVLYNIPSFIIQGFGLPSGDFKHIINIIGLVLFISITIMMVRIVK